VWIFDTSGAENRHTDNIATESKTVLDNFNTYNLLFGKHLSYYSNIPYFSSFWHTSCIIYMRVCNEIQNKSKEERFNEKGTGIFTN